MFNRVLRQLEDDPFFSSSSDPFQMHRDRMRQMMGGFPDPFGQGLMPSITDGGNRTHRGEGQTNRALTLRNDRENIASDPNSHSFSSSSVVTYSKVGNEPAKVFQASSQTRCAPGGIKETRRCLRDSDSGLEKMSIGHHIQDKGHVIEKKENRKTGEKELNQDFQNLDESMCVL